MLKAETKNIQSKLADYCRSGELALADEVNQKHVHHYRRLVYNIIDDIIESAFPVFFEFASDELWDEIVHNFFKEHACQTPQVWKVPGEFYEYACQKDLKTKYNLPFLEDLLLFEWIEMDIHTMKDEEFPKFRADGNLESEVIALNPEYRIISTKYPVHTTPPSQLTPQHEGQYFILIFRQPESGSVQFLDISILHALTIEKIEEGKKLSEIINELMTVFSLPDKNAAKQHLLTFLGDLQEKGFVLGIRS
jgi:hypothetical protein